MKVLTIVILCLLMLSCSTSFCSFCAKEINSLLDYREYGTVIITLCDKCYSELQPELLKFLGNFMQMEESNEK